MKEFACLALGVRQSEIASTPIFHRLTICYFGGSRTFGQIVLRPLAPYNRVTLVIDFSLRFRGWWVVVDVYLRGLQRRKFARLCESACVLLL